MKILITGTAGFIGYHLAKKLLERGDKVIGFDKFVKFTDVKNITQNRFFDFDILYLFVMIEVYMKNLTEIYRLYENDLKSLINGNKELLEIYKLYKTAISINKRYQVNIQC